MTTLGSLLKPAQALDIPGLAAQLALAITAAGHSVSHLGDLSTIIASATAWTQQDDDAHEPCSLTACRAPLHPGPCKGWKGILHSVSPGTFHQLEAERVKKANERRVKRIADLRSQGKPIPRRLLTEIKPKAAPSHPAHAVQPVPLSKVNQQADLAAGQAHHAGQAVSNAAGVKKNVAPPLPLGPKQKKPTVAGRGPAFVITQPKVTDTYKLDKADKITPQEWADLSDHDKTTIRNELTAIKARGFAPQQTKADALLAKLPAATTAPAVSAPGKVTLGQAVKSAPSAPAGSFTQAHTAIRIAEAIHGKQSMDPQRLANAIEKKKATSGNADQLLQPMIDSLSHAALKKAIDDKMTGNPGLAGFQREIGDHIREGKPGLPSHVQKMADHHAAVAAPPGAPSLPPSVADQIKAHQAARAAQAAPAPGNSNPVAQVRQKVGTGGGITGQVKRAQDPSAKLSPAARTFVYGRMSKADYDSLDDAAKKHVHADLDDQIAKGSPSRMAQAKQLKEKFTDKGATGTPSSTPAAPAPSPGIKPSAPLAPGTAAHVQHAVAVTNRTAPKATMGKTHVDAYGKLSKADFDALDPAQQKTIRDDLANAKAKFLDPKKQQAAKDLLDRFGSSHSAPPAPNVPSGAKGYSDPQNEAVKAASGGGSVDDTLKAVGRLAPDHAAQLTPADRKTVLAKLDFIASHPKATPVQRSRADSYRRNIATPPAASGQKLDHEPSLAELHAADNTAASKDAATVANALAAADAKTGLAPGNQRVDRVKALSALSKAQFDALPADQQRKITDALHDLFVAKDASLGGQTQLDPDVEKAFATYTGEHPGMHMLKQAEADFRAGKLDADGVWKALLTARVHSPGSNYSPGSPGDVLAKEEQRIAEDNPKLPLWLRSTMVDNPYSASGGVYHAVASATMSHNWKDAPRLSPGDIDQIFRPSNANLDAAHPIHAEAVKALREHILTTGLGPNSPWSTATKNVVADRALGLKPGKRELTDEDLKDFKALSTTAQGRIERTLRKRLDDQTNSGAKTQTYLALREIDGSKPLTDKQLNAVRTAADSFPTSAQQDAFRKLDPPEFTALPVFAQDAIKEQLADAQKRAERGGPSVTWTTADNPLRVFPAALADHLDGTRTPYHGREQRAAADIANYGTDIVLPESRVQTYGNLSFAAHQAMSTGDKHRIGDDLNRIANDTALPHGTRWEALFTKDLLLGKPAHLNSTQIVAIGSTRPMNPQSDLQVKTALNALDKGEYDRLDDIYRTAIDDRIKTLPGIDQQAINARLHPTMVQAANPSGYTPTTVQPNVPPHVQEALDTIYGTHASGKSHTMAHQLTTYGALRGSDFSQLNGQEQGHLLGDLSFIATTAKGPSADKARKLIDRFTPAGTPAGQVPTGAIVPPANALPGQTRYATPLKGLEKAKDSGTSGDGWYNQGGQQVWGKHGAAGLLLQHTDPASGEKRYLMVQRGPAISDPGKWTFPGGASDSKETPHQGATRETIEELGLKDDVLKDAQVHGDFTYSIPGSNWKYTSVAASVPTMIKPNLSTAHARAETSDAKWLTVAEIKALDANGDLHHPIAGGKLEQNVISLFPQGSGQTLGQAVGRPGPVTSRQQRLRTPYGGRQAPGTTNAWTAPHKPSKGKDLIPDKAALDAQRQKIKQDRKLYDGKTADGRLAAIGAQQGFDDTPTVVDKAEIDRLLATGDYIEAFRGVNGAGGWAARGRGSAGGKTAKQINEEMRTGPAYYGKGIFGNGYYLATQRRVATQYADGTSGSIVRLLIPKSAITAKYDKVSKESHANPRSSKAKGAGYGETSTFYDPGRYAAAKGIDGIEVEHHHVSPGGGAGHVARPGQPAFNWLNRSVLIVQKEPG